MKCCALRHTLLPNHLFCNSDFALLLLWHGCSASVGPCTMIHCFIFRAHAVGIHLLLIIVVTEVVYQENKVQSLWILLTINADIGRITEVIDIFIVILLRFLHSIHQLISSGPSYKVACIRSSSILTIDTPAVLRTLEGKRPLHILESRVVEKAFPPFHLLRWTCATRLARYYINLIDGFDPSAVLDSLKPF